MTAAEVLAQHWMDEDQDCVKCNRHFNRIAEFAAHQLDALKAAGYAVVELPMPDNDNSLAWSAFDIFEVSVWGPLLVQIGTSDTDWAPGEPIAAAVARAYGLALLAAADAAEVDR